MESMKRRTFIKNTALATVGSLFTASIQAKMTTPGEMEGPFYPITPQKEMVC